MPNNDKKPRVLFFAESATLAHVARPIVLAKALQSRGFEVSVATGIDHIQLAMREGLPTRRLHCIGTQAYLSAVENGRPVFPYSSLEDYVHDDIEHIKDFKPDIVVGDLRLSLAVSARLCKVPYIAVSNAYWAPEFQSARYEVPTHRIVGLLGFKASNAIFAAIQPLILAAHCLPMNRLHRRFSIPAPGFSLGRIFTGSDLTVLADVPEMVPAMPEDPPSNYRFIGPITWSPDIPVPRDISTIPADVPTVYVNLGSSGNASLLEIILPVLVDIGCRVWVGSNEIPSCTLPSDKVSIHNLLPGKELAAKADLVICNGGSPSVHQALEAGSPVLGIPSNLDQLLNMKFAAYTGAALSLRADQVHRESIHQSVMALLHQEKYRQRARVVQGWFARYDACTRFETTVLELLAAN